MINRHLMKDFPQYSVKDKDFQVKLLKAIKTDKGLCFTAEIMSGLDKGKLTSVYKTEIKACK